MMRDAARAAVIRAARKRTQQMGIGGKAIPPQIDKVQDLQSDAEFILLVEKDAAFMRLAEDRFYNKFPCVIVTAKGQPDVATRCAPRRRSCACAAHLTRWAYHARAQAVSEEDEDRPPHPCAGPG